MVEYENLRKVNEKLFAEYKTAFNSFLESGWYILGKEVSTFESEFADYVGTDYTVGVASGLDALILSLSSLNLSAGSEIIVPSNTYIATIIAIVKNGFTPVLVEPDIKTYNIDPKRIREKITAKTGAIMVVHLYGKLCHMNDIMTVAEEYKLPVIEDCAQAHGATLNGKQAGSFGTFGAFSFYPTKNLGALGDGGAVTTNSVDYDHELRALRNYGSEVKYHNRVIGINSRLDELQATLLRKKLPLLKNINSHKQFLANLYLEGISDKFIKPVTEDGFNDVFHIFNIRTDKRDQLRDYLLNRGIKTEIHYPVPPHKQEAMKGIIEGEFPISEEIHKTTLSLPISYFHTEKDINFVINTLNEF